VQLTALVETAAVANPSNNRRSEAPTSNLLGLSVIAVDAKTRAQLGLVDGQGVQIARVTNAAAVQAGLSAGDVILQVGRQAVSNTAEFNTAVKAFKSGDSIRMLVRNSQSTGLVTLQMP